MSLLTIMGIHPLTTASNDLTYDGVSPAGLRQKTDLESSKEN